MCLLLSEQQQALFLNIWNVRKIVFRISVHVPKTKQHERLIKKEVERRKENVHGVHPVKRILQNQIKNN